MLKRKLKHKKMEIKIWKIKMLKLITIVLIPFAVISFKKDETNFKIDNLTQDEKPFNIIALRLYPPPIALSIVLLTLAFLPSS